MHKAIARSLLVTGIACGIWAVVVDSSFFRERFFYSLCGIGATSAFVTFSLNKPRSSSAIAALVSAIYLSFIAYPISEKLFSGEWSDLARLVALTYTAPDVAGWSRAQSLLFRVDLLFFQVLGSAYFLVVFVFVAYRVITSLIQRFHAAPRT